MTLQDEARVFLEIEPLATDDPPPDDPGDADGEEGEVPEPAVVGELRAEVERLKTELEAQKSRVRELWKLNCEQLAEMDSSLLQKDEEIGSLKAKVARLRGSSPRPSVPSSTSEDPEQGAEDEGVQRTDRTRVRRGKAPPIDTFTGEDAESRLDDWLPTLQRVADWSGWTPDDLLIQLAGHLKGRALQEWNLLSPSEKKTYKQAIVTLKNRLDPVSKIMAAQDFRHASQEENEKVGDFIRRLEQLFKVAYGHDAISAETRGTLLYGQLQEGLRYRLMEAPAVSGAADYQALRMAAKAEEKRLAELKKRRQYRPDSRRSNTTDTTPKSSKKGDRSMTDQNSDRSTKTGKSRSQRRIAGRCWNCDRPGHMATECRAPKSGASGKTQNGGSSRSPRTNQVQTSTKGGETPTPPVTGTTAQPSDATETTHPNDPL